MPCWSRNRGKRAAAVVLTAISLAVTTASPAAAVVVANSTEPLPSQLFNPCVYETVDVTGYVHSVVSVTTDASGGSHTVSISNDYDASGVGEVTGLDYRAVGTSTDEIQVPATATEVDLVSRFELVAQRPENNFFVMITFHVTISASGRATVRGPAIDTGCR